MLSPEDSATLQAWMEGVDLVAKDCETRWGFGRLPLLVGDELRAKFYRQAAKWREVLEQAWNATIVTRDLLASVESKSAAMQRAWRALDAAASEAGHREVAPYVWEIGLSDGRVAALVQTNAEASKVIAEGRHVAVYTTSEIANLLDVVGQTVAAKIEFPGAKVMPRKGNAAWYPHGEEIPF